LRDSFLKNHEIQLHLQRLQETINLLNLELHKEQECNKSLKEKELRYNSLASILDKINMTLELESVIDTLAKESFILVGKNKGVCILYLIDNQTQKLVLSKSRAEKSGLVIKAKEGDTLDLWVLRHGSALLIEDIKNDFRFDPDRLKISGSRPVMSLASAPFLIENKQLGILRLDNEGPGFYSQDDLRFLVAISELGAIAIENSELFKRAQDLAIHDSLTGLYTKSYFLERLREECKRNTRQNTTLSLLMLDIDFFKKYNDQFGHTAGDIVLQKISKAISNKFIRLSPLISRFGGEEFCIAVSGLDKRDAFKLADELRTIIEQDKIMLRRDATNVTVSAGVANLPEDTLDEEDLIRKADKAMYQAKQEGRNRVCSI
ncbi:MAG: sensor domain-containing diguanylate cyclase, partial [Candidatus Omnitrophica bacterium]|nr:sensor domain-containing diguanylate cyclase [Candidatus Omnitrophota bacterium]